MRWAWNADDVIVQGSLVPWVAGKPQKLERSVECRHERAIRHEANLDHVAGSHLRRRHREFPNRGLVGRHGHRADHLIAAKMEVKDGRLTGRISGDYPYGGLKATIMSHFLRLRMPK